MFVVQRLFLLFLAMLALYVSNFAYATDAPSVDVLMEDLPLSDIPLARSFPPGEKKPDPHIALLLPLKSTIFGASASAVQQGFMAAANLNLTNPHPLSLPVRVYGSFEESKDIVATYRHAIASGARAVVGPLTRSGVSALAEENDIPVPTLALNVTEQSTAPQLFFFGMAIESEARYVARLAAQQGLHQAIVISTRSQLSKRLQSAFESEWSAKGGTLLRSLEFNGDYTAFANIAARQDTVVFLATDAANARLIKPYLPNGLPIYASSLIFTGNHETLLNYDLNNIHFVDMPWLLQPDHPAAMIYPRPDPPLSAELERLYAIGIDAFRLVQLMIGKQAEAFMPLDGVSGHIRLENQIFQREPIHAIFMQGKARPVDAVPLPDMPMFPDQPVSEP